MQKADITKTVITVQYTAKTKNNKKVIRSFPISLQRWIQKTPEEQEKYVASHTVHQVITYNIL